MNWLLRLSPCVVLPLLAACPNNRQGGAKTVVSYNRLDTSPACIRVAATDAHTLDSGAPTRATTDVPISGSPLSGQVVVAVAAGADWSAELDVSAELHMGTCATPAVAQDRKRVTLHTNELLTVTLSVTQPGAGTDGGLGDAGAGDAGGPDGGGTDGGGAPDGGDAGLDAGSPDAGTFDAGPPDAGSVDAGVDAGVTDAGFDAGPPDAGPADSGTFDAGPSCTGSFFALPSPKGSVTFYGASMLDTNIAILVGDTASIYAITSDGGNDRWDTNACGGDFGAVWARQLNQVFVASSTDGLVRFTGPGSCTASVATLNAGSPSGMAAYPSGGNSRVWVSEANPPSITSVLIDAAGNAVAASTKHYTAGAGLPTAGDEDIYGIAGTSDSNVFAVGHKKSGYLLKYDGNGDHWVSVSANADFTDLNAIDFAAPDAGFAGGDDFWLYDGTSWSKAASSPSFVIYGLKAYSPTNVFAVGPDQAGHFSVARWNGSSWLPVTTPSRGSGGTPALFGIAGTHPCDTWAVGTSGSVVTTNDRP